MPSRNPICKHKVKITGAHEYIASLLSLVLKSPVGAAGAVSVVAQVVDYCLTCGVTDVGLPKMAFKVFGNSTQGIVPNVSWEVI